MERRKLIVEISADLVRRIDELVGSKRRDEFIETAVRRALRSEAIRRFKELGGSPWRRPATPLGGS